MAGPNRTRRVFDKAFKLNAVRMVIDEGLSQEEVCLKLNLARGVLSQWVKEFKQSQDEAFPGKGRRLRGEAEIVRLRRELKEAQDERDILKKALTELS